MTAEILRYTAFAAGDPGGNPAGVVLDANGMSDQEMLAVAAEVGFSETAFLFPAHPWQGEADEPAPDRQADVRYFSPLAEVAFCGHATIAAAVALAERHGAGNLELVTRSGPVPVVTRWDGPQVLATLTSVPPSTYPIPDERLDHTLAALGWSRDVLDDALPPRVAFAGAYHAILAVKSRETLAGLDYDYEALAPLMASQDWTTVQLVQRESDEVFHARDPFPPGGVVEDPATGAAAAALGGYLREMGLVPPSRRVSIHQGVDMGRPSLLLVDIPEQGGIRVSGSASRL